ncbi:MAG: PD-(D/E)XK nuclease domain-containing protein [Muribaculaceae bacterium]|nr:PD-(D/E)XK nuclease domain-containing protein [Muribaculaceae bacterium]
MEFKLKSTSKPAMQQIRDKEYALPFLSDGREVILIGDAFRAKTHPQKWIIEKI